MRPFSKRSKHDKTTYDSIVDLLEKSGRFKIGREHRDLGYFNVASISNPMVVHQIKINRV